MSMYPGDTYTKDPDGINTRGFDWTAYLLALGSATISASTYLVEPVGGITLSSPGIIAGNLKTVVTLSAGTAGVRYVLTNRITASTGNVDDKSIYVLVEST